MFTLIFQKWMVFVQSKNLFRLPMTGVWILSVCVIIRSYRLFQWHNIRLRLWSNKIRIVNLKCCMVAKCLWQILNIILYIIMIIANLKMQHLSCLTWKQRVFRIRVMKLLNLVVLRSKIVKRLGVYRCSLIQNVRFLPTFQI